MSYFEENYTIDVASSGTTSTPFQIAPWVSFVGLLFPAMDDGDITLQVSFDGTTYYPVLDPADGNDLVVCGSGDDPGIMDISDYVRFVPSTAFVRIACASQSSGAVEIGVYVRG